VLAGLDRQSRTRLCIPQNRIKQHGEVLILRSSLLRSETEFLGRHLLD